MRRGGDAGQRCGGVAQAVLQCHDLRRLAVRNGRDRRPDGDHALRIEPRCRGREVEERPEQKYPAEQQHNRYRDLRGDEDVRHAAVPHGQAAPRIAAQIRADPRVAQTTRPREAREKRRAERAGGGNRQDAAVERHVRRERKRVGIARDEPQRERLRERDAERAGDGEEREAFRPQLSGQASRRCADGAADAKLQGARVRLGQEQVGDVRAGDGQQHRDRQREQHHHRLDRPDHRVLQSVEAYGAIAVRVRIGSGQPRGNRRDLAPGCRHRGIGAQPADRRQRDRSALVQKRGRRKRERGPHIGAARGEPIGLRRKHTHDRVAHGADLQRAADGGRVAGEMRLPEPVSQHDGRRRAEAVLFRLQRASDLRPDAEHRDHLRGGEHQRGREGRRVVCHTHRSGLDVIQADRIRGASTPPSSPARRGNSPPARVRYSRPSC